MKRIIFILIFPFFLFASENYCVHKYGLWLDCSTAFVGSTGSKSADLKYLKEINAFQNKPGDKYVYGVFGGLFVEYDSKKFSNYDSDCFNKHSSKEKVILYFSHGYKNSSIFVISADLADFCDKTKHPGYFYAPEFDAWVAPGQSSICPPDKEYSYVTNKCEDKKNCSDGKVFDYTQEKCVSVCPDNQIYDPATKKCIDPPKCPDYMTLLDQVSSSCSGKENVINLKCDEKTGKITYECLQCKDIVSMYVKECKDQNKTIDFKCNSSSNSLNFNYKCKDINDSDFNTSNINLNNTPIVCEGDQDIVINEDGNISCVNTGHSSVDSNDNNISNSSNNTSNNINDNSNSSNNNSNNTSNSTPLNLDCCNLYNNQSVGDQWIQISTGVWKQLNSPNCIVTVSNGVCSISSSSSSSNSNNQQLSDISSKISDSNSKLDKINQNFDDIKNLQPTNNPDSSLDDQTESFFSGFSDTVSNIKDSVNSVKDSANQLIDLLNNPTEFSQFSSDTIETCPVYFTVYNNRLSVDICKSIYPYHSLIQTFFTIIFSILVLLYFFDVFIRSK